MPREQQQRFQEWRENPVTNEVFDAIKARVLGALENLSVSTNTHEYDLFLKGMILAYREVLDVNLDMTIEGIDKDEV